MPGCMGLGKEIDDASKPTNPEPKQKNINDRSVAMGRPQIIIDLKESRAAKVLDYTSLLHQKVLDDLQVKFESLAEEAKRYDPKKITIHQHEVINISGGRGSGKTTLICNLFDLLRPSSNQVNNDCRDLCNNYGSKKPECDENDIKKKKKAWSELELFPLDIIDPTLLGDRENIFITIISKIKRVVEKAEECSSRDYDRPDRDGKFNAWRETMRKLAIGVSQLEIHSDKHNEIFYGDEDILLLEGLKKSRHGADLERDFHVFVKESVQLLGAQAFVIAFDDIDTSFERGWPVLEIVRKYLTTPHMITIICGDIELYSKLVRKRQWENFGDLPQKDGDKAPYEHMVNMLEGQYILKLFKPDNRFELVTLKQYVDGNDYEIKVKFGEDTPDLIEVVSGLRKSLKLPSSAQVNYLLNDLILSQPVRTIIRLLDVYNIHKPGECKEASVFNVQFENFIRQVTNVFNHTMLKYGYTKKSIAEIGSNSSLKRLVINLNRIDIIRDAYGLKSEYFEGDKSIFLMILGQLYAIQLRKHPAGYIDYFIIIGLAREISVQWPFTENEEEYSKLLDRYIKFVGLDTIEHSMQTARKFLSFYRPNADGKAVKCGTVRVYPESVMNRNTETYIKKHYIENSLDDLKKNTEIATKLDVHEALSDKKQLDKFLTEGIDNKLLKKLHDIEAQPIKGMNGHMWKFLFKIKGYREENKNDENMKKKNEIDAFQEIFNTIYSLDSAITSFHRYFAKIPFSVNVTRAGDTVPFASIFNVLGLVSLVLGTVDEQHTDKDWNKSKTANESGAEIVSEEERKAVTEAAIKKYIEEVSKEVASKVYVYSQIRLFPVYHHSGEAPENMEARSEHSRPKLFTNADLKPLELNEISEGFNGFCQLLTKWALLAVDHSRAMKELISVAMLSRIWGRFYYNLRRIDDAVADQDMYMGYMLHRFIVAFLNSVLVESLIIHHDNKVEINIRNIVDNDEAFEENLKLWKQDEDKDKDKDKEKYSFFNMLFACPLWGLYLNHRKTEADKTEVYKNYIECMQNFIEKARNFESYYEVKYLNSSKMVFRSLYTPLNSILVMRTPYGKPPQPGKPRYCRQRNHI
jgi:energy-coupling factor transporter ATP-binding protein EcfA2